MINITKVEEEFKRIKHLGFIKTTRPNNRDGGIGNTFEDLLGVEENNLKDPDFEGFEVKTQRYLNSSYITLFSKSPSFPKKANSILKEKYGEIRDPEFPDLKKLYASIFGHRWGEVYGKYKMKLDVNLSEKKVYLLVDNFHEINKDVYWDFEDLQKGLQKLNNLFVVSAKTKTENEDIFFHYDSGSVFLDIDFKKFISQLQIGNIQFDIRIGVHKSGKNYGKPHDHGSGFRVKKDNLINLYNKCLEF
jgi:hypothetical protein